MEDPTITLQLPRQDKTALQLFQASRESAQDWVQNLPIGDTSTVVRMLNEAFDDLNRTTLPPDTRYSLMETLLPSLEVALTTLAKRFLNQPLIMPGEPRKMAESSNQMFSMAITGYTIVALEAIQQRDNISTTNPARLTCAAIQRALMFCGRKILQAFQLHQPMDPHNWEIPHQLYALAEFQKLVDLPVPEPLDGGSSIKAAYLQGILLGCCKPNQLRQSDLAALYRGLQQWAELVQINTLKTGSELFLVDLDSDQPPQYRALYREQFKAGCRTLDTTVLVEHLKTLRAEISDQGASFDKQTNVSRVLLDHLIASLGSMSMRNFKRTASNSPLWVCVGLSNTHYQVARQQQLKQTGNEDQRSPFPRQAQNNPFMPSLSKSDLWAKANPMEHQGLEGEGPGYTIDLDAATRARFFEQDLPEAPQQGRQSVFEVQLADTSANGYCLEWLDELPSDLKAGDLVGVKEDKKQNEWSIAVIRWISRLQDARTLLGLELLSPRAIAYGARIHRSGDDDTPPMKVLLLPEIKIVGQPSTLITPRAGFKEKQKVTLRNNVEKHTVQLTRQITSTGSFEQFEFRYIKELGDILAETRDSQLHGEFDSLWSNI